MAPFSINQGSGAFLSNPLFSKFRTGRCYKNCLNRVKKVRSAGTGSVIRFCKANNQYRVPVYTIKDMFAEKTTLSLPRQPENRYASLLPAVPVPMSGAGTSRPGPRKLFLASSSANRRVIRSSSDSEQACGLEKTYRYQTKHQATQYAENGFLAFNSATFLSFVFFFVYFFLLCFSPLINRLIQVAIYKLILDLIVHILYMSGAISSPNS